MYVTEMSICVVDVPELVICDSRMKEEGKFHLSHLKRWNSALKSAISPNLLRNLRQTGKLNIVQI